MRIGTLIDLSATLEPWIAVGAGAALVVLVANRVFADHGPGPMRSLDAPIAPGTERRLLLTILAVALAIRVVGWDSALTPVFWFSEISSLYVDEWVRTGKLWEVWLQKLHATQVWQPHDSAIVLPLRAAFQRVLGMRFGLPVLEGALFGTVAVLLAWALGRRVRSQGFGLAFAALVACSPLAVAWSRLSGFCTGAVTHVLLALVVGYAAGRRQSLLLAIAAGAVAWTSIYEYHAARVTIPLELLAILAGSQRSLSLRGGALLAGVAALTFLAIFHELQGGVVLTQIWPSYGGYAGNKGERTLGEFVARNLDSAVTEMRHTIEAYFVARRAGWAGVGEPGMQNGGLALVPTGALGVVGVAWVCAHLRRQWLWLALGALGLALPSLSVATARRMLVLDLAWCACAAHGLLAIVDGLGRGFSYAARARATIAILAVLGLWSITVLFALNAVAPATAATPIPFGEAGFGDGISCKRCLEAAKDWERAIAGGAFVVLFDNDAYRENLTSPGGLVTYGRMATIAAGARGRFVEMYALMWAASFRRPALSPTVGRPPSRVSWPHASRRRTCAKSSGTSSGRRRGRAGSRRASRWRAERSRPSRRRSHRATASG